VEFAGSTIAAMSVGGRLVLCNMAAEMGAKNAYVAPDETTRAWLAARSQAPYQAVLPDPTPPMRRCSITMSAAWHPRWPSPTRWIRLCRCLT